MAAGGAFDLGERSQRVDHGAAVSVGQARRHRDRAGELLQFLGVDIGHDGECRGGVSRQLATGVEEGRGGR